MFSFQLAQVIFQFFSHARRERVKHTLITALKTKRSFTCRTFFCSVEWMFRLMLFFGYVNRFVHVLARFNSIFRLSILLNIPTFLLEWKCCMWRDILAEHHLIYRTDTISDVDKSNYMCKYLNFIDATLFNRPILL